MLPSRGFVRHEAEENHRNKWPYEVYCLSMLVMHSGLFKNKNLLLDIKHVWRGRYWFVCTGEVCTLMIWVEWALCSLHDSPQASYTWLLAFTRNTELMRLLALSFSLTFLPLSVHTSQSIGTHCASLGYWRYYSHIITVIHMHHGYRQSLVEVTQESQYGVNLTWPGHIPHPNKKNLIIDIGWNLIFNCHFL